MRQEFLGNLILPGLVDIHNHSAMAHDYMEATEAAFDAISSCLAEHGLTTAQCATVSAPLEQILRFLAFTARNVASGRYLCCAEMEN